MNRKQEIQDVVKYLQAARSNHDIQQVVRWLDLVIEEARDALVITDRDGHDTAASKVVTLSAVRQVLTRPSMAETQAKYSYKE